MRDDLLEAVTSVDWAKSKFESFEERLHAWCDHNIVPKIVKLDSNPTQDMLLAVENELLPLEFNVEAGAYINAIRSSLDMVAWAVYNREPTRPLHPREVYFPVAESADAYTQENFKGSKFIRQLSGTHRELFEACKPYKGGNDALFALHELDNTRKHKRLLFTYTRPAHFRVRGWGVGFTYPAHFINAGNGETVLGFVNKGSKPEVTYTGHVVIGETGILEVQPVIRALNTFTECAKAIIKVFDGP